MRKKQLFALALAGMLTVSMAPAVSAADADEQGAVAAAAETEGGTEETGDILSGEGDVSGTEGTGELPGDNTGTDDGQEPSEGEGTQGSETPAGEEPSPAPDVTGEEEQPTQPPAQEPTQEPVQTPEGEAGVTPGTQEVKEPGEENKTEDIKEEDGEDDKEDTEKQEAEAATAEDIKKALADAAAAEDKTVQIKLTQEKVEIAETIIIPQGVTASFVSTSETGTKFTRSGAFAGSLFQADGTLILGGEGDKGIVADGAFPEGTQIPEETQVAPMFLVSAGGAMTANAAIFQNNKGTGNGGAISSLGTLVLNSVTITGNTAAEGGAVYAEAPISVSGLLTVKDNTKTDGVTADNICMAGNTSYLELGSDLAEGSVVNLHLDPTAELTGSIILKASEGAAVDLEKNLTYLTYENGGNHWTMVVPEVEGENFVRLSVRLDYVEKSLKRESFDKAVAKLKAYGCEGGKVYTTWTVRDAYTGNDTPADEDFQEAGTIEAEEFDVTFDNLNEKSVDCYVYIKDAAGNASEKIRLQPKDMDPTGTEVSLKASAVSRNSLSEATFKLDTANCQGGSYYYAWVKRGAAAPKEFTKGGNISKDSFQVTVKGITQASVDCYFYVEDAEGNTSSTVKVQPADWKATKPTVEYNSSTRKSLSELEITLDTKNAIGGKVYFCWTKRGEYTGGSGPKDGYKAVADITSDQVKATVKGITESSIDGYFYVTDKDGNKSSVYRFSPRDWAVATPTPTPTPVPKVPNVTESQVVGLDQPYNRGSKVTFGVSGAGMDNTNPNPGDVRYLPYRWKADASEQTIDQVLGWVNSSGSPQGMFQQSSNGYYYGQTTSTSGIAAGTYYVTIVFKTQTFDGTNWVDGDYVKMVKPFVITGQAPTNTPVPGSTRTPGSTYVGEDGTEYEVLDDGTVVTKAPNGTSQNNGDGTSKNAVATADETPIVPMVSLLLASMLAGGYVLTRKRKKAD